MKKTFHLLTHGCKVNQYESEAIAEAWKAAGFNEVEAAAADILVLVSCAVTAKAATAGRRSLKSLRALNPDAELVFTGCAAALPDFRNVGEADAIFTPAQKDLLLQYPRYAAMSLPISALAREKDIRPVGPGQPGRSGRNNDDPANTGAQKFPAFTLGSRQRSRATLKIQDGCSHGCAYCIVPLARGPSRSREFSAILAEAGALLQAGLRELVISGINLRQFTPGLWQLIDYLERELPALARAPRKDSAGSGRENSGQSASCVTNLDATNFGMTNLGMINFGGTAHNGTALGGTASNNAVFEATDKIRLRLSSLDPAQLDERALESLARARLLAPHLHLSLQSGSPATLKRMRRSHYQPENILQFLQKLRAVWPDFALGTDILLGFPGESEQEFSETLDFIKALPLSYAHVFPFSKRPGTLAATYPEQVGRGLAKERAGLVRELAEQKQAAFLERLMQKQLAQEVVFELPSVPVKTGTTELKGVSQFYADCLLSRRGLAGSEKISAIIPCQISGIKDNMLLVEPL